MLVRPREVFCFFLFSFWLLHTAGEISLLKDPTGPPAVEVQRLSQWTTREVCLREVLKGDIQSPLLQGFSQEVGLYLYEPDFLVTIRKGLHPQSGE